MWISYRNFTYIAFGLSWELDSSLEITFVGLGVHQNIYPNHNGINERDRRMFCTFSYLWPSAYRISILTKASLRCVFHIRDPGMTSGGCSPFPGTEEIGRLVSPQLPTFPRKRKFRNKGLTHFFLVLDSSHLFNYVNYIIKKKKNF